MNPGLIIRPFGPTIYKSTVSEEFRQEILHAAKHSDIPNNKNLAGNIEREVAYEFSEASKKELTELLTDYLEQSVKAGAIDAATGVNMTPTIERPWVNVQRKGEWNPPHIHSGDFSCIIYASVPEALKDEWKHPTQQGNSPTGGMVEWHYGQWAPHNITTLGPVAPVEGDIFFFPAWLLHHVYPFNADVERISCSTNFILQYAKFENTTTVSGWEE